MSVAGGVPKAVGAAGLSQIGPAGRFPQLVAAGPGGPRKDMKIVGSAEWRRWERRGRD